VLKRKRDDEYVVKDFQVPDADLPDASSLGIHSESQKMNYGDAHASKLMEQSAMEGIPPAFDLGKLGAEGMSSYNVLGSGFGDVGSGNLQVTCGSINMSSTSISMATSGLGVLTSSIESIPGAELFDMHSGVPDGSSVADLEGILSSLPGASHLSVDSALDFDAGLGKNLLQTYFGIIPQVNIEFLAC
jgi:hypothetical protein